MMSIRQRLSPALAALAALAAALLPSIARADEPATPPEAASPAEGATPPAMDAAPDAAAVGEPSSSGAAADAVPAPVATEGAPPAHTKTVDIGGAYSSLTNGYGTWQSVTGRLVYEPEAGNTSYAEVSLAREFSENGAIVSLGHVHELAQLWIISGFVTLGGGGDFEPRVKGDLSLGRKLLADQSLIATIGVSADHFKDGHSDKALLTSLAWYGIPLWVIEGGIRFNWSNPGDVAGRRYWLASTWGREGHDFVVVRGETGNESYQIIGAGQPLVDFNSELLSLTWRHWLRPDRGFVVGGEVYHNPAYDRYTISAAAFFQF